LLRFRCLGLKRNIPERVAPLFSLDFVPEELDGAVVSNDFPVFKINTSLVCPSFLEWMSKTKGFVDICKAASEGTTNRVRLKEDRFLAMQILLPSPEEQQRIVGKT